jgi:hypothetical protein
VTKKRFFVYVVCAAILIVGVFAGPALAVNDPFSPADQCDAPQGEAVGHPAAANEQSDVASPPFSANNPGQSDGAEGAGSGGDDHCANAQP